MKMKNAVLAFIKEEDGLTLVEYSLGAALIAVAAIAGMDNIATALNNTFDFIATKLPNS